MAFFFLFLVNVVEECLILHVVHVKRQDNGFRNFKGFAEFLPDLHDRGRSILIQAVGNPVQVQDKLTVLQFQ